MPSSLEKSERIIGSLFVSPTLIILLSLMFYPLAQSLWISFHRWQLKEPSTIGQFIGLANWSEVINSFYFKVAMFNTILFASISILFSMLISLGIALVLNEDFLGSSIIKSIILIPWAIPGIANAMMWKWIYDSRYGALNIILYQLGLIDEFLAFLSTPSLAQFSVINAFVYRMVPFGTVVILAALQTVPKDLLESAEIDGAGAMRRFISITWPWIRSAFLIVLIMNTLDAFRAFDVIYALTYGGPGYATTILSWFVYQESFTFLDFGHGSVLAYMLAIITSIIAVIYFKVLKPEEIR